jgi:hypothetical protein
MRVIEQAGVRETLTGVCCMENCAVLSPLLRWSEVSASLKSSVGVGRETARLDRYGSRHATLNSLNPSWDLR